MMQPNDMQMRVATQQKRRPPGEPTRIDVGFTGNGELPDNATAGPIELTIEATNADGDLAVWFDDFWWTDVIERWGWDFVTLHLAPTPRALLHPVVLHQMEMVSRVAPRWRIVAHVYRDDVSTEDAIESLACSPYHEVRFIDEERCVTAQADRASLGLPIGDLLGRIRRDQRRLQTTRPVLVKLPAAALKLPTPAAVEPPAVAGVGSV
jgi:hypothetical protein